MTDASFDASMKQIFRRPEHHKEEAHPGADEATRQVLDQDLRRRERLIDRFRSSVLSKTEAMCNRIAPIAQEAGYKVIRISSNTLLDGSIAQIAYSISYNRNAGARIIPLHFALMLNGTVFVGTPREGLDPSFVPVSFVTTYLDMHQADLTDRLKQAFQTYVEKAVTILHRKDGRMREGDLASQPIP